MDPVRGKMTTGEELRGDFVLTRVLVRPNNGCDGSITEMDEVNQSISVAF